MTAFSIDRIEDMLRIYGDKEVTLARLESEKICMTLTPYEAQQARHRGECRAWAAHDSFFIWTKPLANDFAALKAFVVREQPPHVTGVVRDWLTLHEITEKIAISFLGRMAYPPCPAMLPTDHETYWWQLIAIMHECDRHTGKTKDLYGGPTREEAGSPA